MIFEFLFIMSHFLLYSYIVSAVQAYLDTTPTESFFDCPEFEVSDPWHSLMVEEYMEDILKNSCEDTDCSDYETIKFDIFRKRVEDDIGPYYQSGGKTKHCIILKQ
jgi:hypothetical protein